MLIWLSPRKVFIPVQHKIEKEWTGSDYGGFYVHMPALNESSVVLSFGVGEDVSFDRQLIENRQVKIYAFDPTPGVEKFVHSLEEKTGNFHFFPVGLGVKDRNEWFYPPENPEHISGSVVPREATREKAFPVQMKTLSTIVAEADIGRFDVLKLDIEGAEYDVIPQVLHSGFKPPQILVEVHPGFFPDGRKRTRELVKLLNDYGYKIFGVSDSCRELSFILQ
ncbi:MAG: FkbM family methyltransferase [Bacteroidota bacterium]